MADVVDVVIVGAGAAGLAAAMRLERTSASYLVLEAQERVGGRAHTITLGGFPVDLGCGWLHSADRNPFAHIAGELGFPLDKSPPHWMRQMAGAGMTAAEQGAYREALEALEIRIDVAARAGRDVPVSTLMDPGDPWNPRLDAFSSYYNGAEFDQVSTRDYAAFDDSGVNWRAPRGYGALIGAWAASARVRLATPVRRIDRTGRRVRIETAGGALDCAGAIVTIPTPLIADGSIAIAPDLPDMRDAAAALPLGLADKVFLGLAGAESLPAETHVTGDPRRTETGSYHIRPFGRPMIEAFFGGRCAEALEAEGPGAAAAFAVEELVSRLGSGLRARLTPLGASRWRADPFARGSYSHALPSQATARAVLARPVDERLFFAGEAVSAHGFSTAHGAFETGKAAADAALAALGRGSSAS
jgi:monoamine oxidase